jgi:hypothetical protein
LGELKPQIGLNSWCFPQQCQPSFFGLTLPCFNLLHNLAIDGFLTVIPTITVIIIAVIIPVIIMGIFFLLAAFDLKQLLTFFKSTEDPTKVITSRESIIVIVAAT